MTSPRRFAPATTVVNLDAAVHQDLVRPRFDTTVLNPVWTSDTTCQRTGQGTLDLCAVWDGCSWRVIGWAVDEHTDLVRAAPAMAVAMHASSPMRSSCTLTAAECTSAQLARFAREHIPVRSIGRTVVCRDNTLVSQRTGPPPAVNQRVID